MSVEAFTVDGKVTIDTTPFESGIAKVTSQLSELSGSMKSMMEMGGGNWNFNGALNGLKTLKDDLAVIKEDIATMNTEFANTQGINALKTEIASLRSEIDAIKQKVNETTTQTVQRVREVKTEISAITSGTEPLVQLWTAMNGQIADHYDILSYQESEIGQINAQWRETQTSINRTKQLMKQIYNETEGWTTELSRVELQAKQIELYFRREQDILKQSLNYLEQEATLLESQKALEDAKLVAEENLNKAIAERVAFYNETIMQEEKEMEMAYRIMGIQEELNGLIGIEAEEVLKIADSEKLVLSTIEEQVAMEEERLALMSEITAMQNAQITKVPTATGKGAKGMMGNDLDKMSYLPRRIGSMALTMWGFNEIMDIYDKAMQNINAYGSQKTYADLMRNDSRYLTQTKQDVNDINTGVKELNKSINETYKGSKSLQQMYQKVDMQSVGANAMDTAFKYGVQAENLDELAEVMAIYGSEFVRQGRSQEDSILAVNDALDGEIRRLKEVGIDREDLEAKGWKEGDTMSMINALREIAEERGYDVVAQKVTNLSDAITVLEIRIAQDLVGAFKVLEPFLTEVANDFIFLIGKLEEAWIGISNIGKGLKGILDDTFGKDNVNNFGSGLLNVSAWVVTLGISFAVLYKIVKSIVVPLKDLLKIGKEAEGIGGAVAKDTGGIGKTMNTGGFKENFSSEWGKLGKNLGKMARVFVEVAVAMAMAFALIEEGILLISAVGYTYESLKPQFNQGIEFIKEFGLWFALLGGAMLGLSYAIGQIPQGVEKAITKGATRLAYGMAIAMGLIAEAIVLLIAPMTAIALLGGTASFLGTNLDKGLEVISWIGNALHQIDLPVALFIGGFLAISLLLGLVQPLTLALAVGIASALLLVTEAIGMLIAPLTAIALLGGTASMLGEDKIQQGAETIKLIGNVLQVLAQAIPYLLVVDLTIFGVQLVEWGNRLLSGGKDGLTTLVQDILPTIQTFISDFNGLDFSKTLDTAKITAITTVATQLPPLFTAIQKLNNAMGTSDALGNIGGALGGSISGAIGMGLKSKLDQLYNDVKDVMDFASKLGGLSTGNGGKTTAIQQTANAIAQLKVKLNLFITTISSASSRVQSASQRLGSALTTGFKTGSASFNPTVVSTLAKGISEVQSRYATWLSGGKTSAQKLTDGFKTIGGKLRSIIRTEMGYALRELDDYKDDFYTKGQSLGEALSDGFKSKGGLWVGSPANIARTIAKEMEYSMLALDNGKQLMYKGGQALGQALTNGYNSYGNLRTDVGVLASKGVSNEQLQANAKNTQLNGNQKGQTPQLTQTNINIDMSNSTVIGVQDLDNKIRQAVEKAIVSINSPNGAIGY